MARPAAPVAMTVFGRPERSQSTAMFKAVAELMPASPTDGVMAAPPMVRATRTVGHETVREALAETFQPFQTQDGRYALEEEAR